MNKKIASILLVFMVFSLQAMAQNVATFTVRIENVSTATTLQPSDGSMQAVPVSPGVWAIHTWPAPLFTVGEADRGDGLEAIAEDGSPGMLADALSSQDGIIKSNIFNTPVGAEMPAPIGPGGAYEIKFMAVQGSYFSFAGMFVPSNDLVLATGEMGLSLFNPDGSPASGDMTEFISIWDVGSEENEEPGVGANQVQRQSGPNTGPADSNPLVRLVDDGFTYPQVSDVIKVSITSSMAIPFSVKIENVSTDSTLKPSDGSMQFIPFAPGVWALHGQPGALFTAGQADYGLGLEGIAEDGNPAELGATIAGQEGVYAAAVFNTPAGAESPGPLLPANSYEFTVFASEGMNLSFATMFVPSNDLFYAPDENGIPLFDETGMPKAGDATQYLMLWDAGTEENEEPGVGANQAQRQVGPNTGPTDSNSLVRLVDDSFTYPNLDDVIRLTITPLQTFDFILRVENVSTGTTLQPSDGSMQAVPLAPGAWAVHTGAAPIFTTGEADRGEGLEAISEDGSPAMLAGNLAGSSGIIASGVFSVPEGAEGPAPIGPGGAYEFTFSAFWGAKVSLATMFIPSNDLFFSPDEQGVDLFDAQGMPIAGDITQSFSLWDAGTEENEEPGVGPNQAQRQSGANTGPADSNTLVRMVSDAFTYPATEAVIRVTINPAPTSVAGDESGDLVPGNFSLAQNYPNPFNPSTSISYALNEAGRVQVAIYNLLGEKIVNLVDGYQETGNYSINWDARNSNGVRVASGIYFYRLESNNRSAVRRMMLLK